MAEYANFENEILYDIGIADQMYQRGRADAAVKSQYEQEVRVLETEVAELRDCSNHMRDLYSNIKSYAIKHRERARNILDLAIQEAGELVPDADTKGIHLSESNNNTVAIINDKGQNINVREGCGYRAILGALLRYACLKAQPDALPLILYDEYFFTLSDVTTSLMRDIFKALTKDISIIVVEQRRNAMSGIVDREYTFKKDDKGTSTVTCTYDVNA